MQRGLKSLCHTDYLVASRVRWLCDSITEAVATANASVNMDGLIRGTCGNAAMPLSEQSDVVDSFGASPRRFFYRRALHESCIGPYTPASEEPKMNRIQFIATLIVCLGLPFFATSTHAAERKMDPVATDNCIKACNDCLRACRECLVGCDCPACEKGCLTCIETCRACVALMEYESPLCELMCGVCEKACETCAGECLKCGTTDACAKKCADACEKCRIACKAVSMGK